jgi:dihydrofolate reductase
VAGRCGATIAGRKTYDDSGGWAGGGPHPTARLFVLSHRPPPEPPVSSDRQTFIDGIEAAVGTARQAAGPDKDVALTGSAPIAAAVRAGLLDEVVLHVVPVLLDGGTRFVDDLPERVALTPVGVVAAPGVTHLHYAVSG